MTDKRPQTIQFFLPQGEPRGVRIADITTRIVQAVLVPRSKLGHAAKREEIRRAGVYFLFGERRQHELLDKLAVLWRLGKPEAER